MKTQLFVNMDKYYSVEITDLYYVNGWQRSYKLELAPRSFISRQLEYKKEICPLPTNWVHYVK